MDFVTNYVYFFRSFLGSGIKIHIPVRVSVDCHPLVHAFMSGIIEQSLDLFFDSWGLYRKVRAMPADDLLNHTPQAQARDSLPLSKIPADTVLDGVWLKNRRSGAAT